jgi:[ribosomal protein S18]-alanine N-acetyltransferase
MIRHFMISDLHPLLDIEHQAFPKSPYDWATFLNLQWIYPQSFLVYVERKVTEREEQLWGYVVFSLDGHIISLAVHPEKRRKGIGRQLLRSVTHYPQIKKIWAEVRVSNQGAQMFYQRMGFETLGRLPNYYGDEDALIIQRFLPFDDLY